MPSHLEEKQEKLEQIIQKLLDESAKGIPIIVEGQKDAETLRALGVTGKIINAKTGRKTFIDLVTEITEEKPRRIILMLDHDRTGRIWMAKLKQHLERGRIIADSTLWAELFGLAGRDIKDVESLTAYMETLKSKIHNS